AVPGLVARGKDRQRRESSVLRSAAASAAGRARPFPRHLSAGGLSEAMGARREPELERAICRSRAADVQQRVPRAVRQQLRVCRALRCAACSAPRSRRSVLRRREPLDREERLNKRSIYTCQPSVLLALAYSKPAMTTVTRPSILHVSAAEGGGVDRYIRDIAANVPRRHFLWHVGSG